MNVLIVGPGAQGSFLSYLLQKNNITFGLWGKQGFVEPGNLSVIDTDNKKTPINPSIREWTNIDLLLLAVKAYSVEDFLKTQGHKLKDIKAKVLLCNGWIYPTMEQWLIRNPEQKASWRQGVSTFGVSQDSNNCYRIKSATGEISYGPIGPEQDQKWAYSFETSLAAKLKILHLRADIGPILRKKWLMNTVLNTLTAALHLSQNGMVLKDKKLLKQVFDEAYALGIAIFGKMDLEKNVAWQDLLDLIDATRENENSMARDRRLGRQTESKFLAGLATDPQKYPLLNKLHHSIITSGSPHVSDAP